MQPCARICSSLTAQGLPAGKWGLPLQGQRKAGAGRRQAQRRPQGSADEIWYVKEQPVAAPGALNCVGTDQPAPQLTLFEVTSISMNLSPGALCTRCNTRSSVVNSPACTATYHTLAAAGPAAHPSCPATCSARAWQGPQVEHRRRWLSYAPAKCTRGSSKVQHC